jgi:hypothetical protein
MNNKGVSFFWLTLYTSVHVLVHEMLKSARYHKDTEQIMWFLPQKVATIYILLENTYLWVYYIAAQEILVIYLYSYTIRIF